MESSSLRAGSLCRVAARPLAHVNANSTRNYCYGGECGCLHRPMGQIGELEVLGFHGIENMVQEL